MSAGPGPSAPSPLRQVRGVMRLELRKVFSARRGLWVYLLALAPFLLFLAMTVQARLQRAQPQMLAARQEKPLTAADFRGIVRGMPRSAVRSELGPPARVAGFARVRSRDDSGQVVFRTIEVYTYSDGVSIYTMQFTNDRLVAIDRRAPSGFADLTQEFAAVFQDFYLRLAIFFGCLGIFMNLFRGELLDKSLHFYFLTPVARPRILAGKFLAGLVAAGAIFTASAALQWLMLRAQMDAATRQQFMSSGQGLHQLAAYLGVTLLACAGYGSLFLAAGIRFRNPILPAGAILVWEYLNPFLPAALKKISIIYYLKALCPVPLIHDPSATGLGAVFASSPDAISRFAAIVGVLVVAAVVLAASGYWVKRLEIDYTTE